MDDKQRKILNIARSLIGTPYKYAVPQEEIPKFLDCSSFTRYIFKQIGVDLPRSTILQATVGKEILSDDLQAGDLIFYRGDKGHYDDELFNGRKIYIGHVAMYTEENKAIHASFKNGVIEEALKKISTGRGLIVMIKRIL